MSAMMNRTTSMSSALIRLVSWGGGLAKLPALGAVGGDLVCRRVVLTVLLAGQLLLARLSDGAVVLSLEPNPEKPTRATLSSERGRLAFGRGQWQALTLETAGGKALPVVDLLLYNSGIGGSGPGYWAAPGNWEELLSATEAKGNDSGKTLLIEGRFAGVKKQAYVTVYPDLPAVLVVNRLLAEDHDVAVRHDHQLTWASANSGESMHASEVVLDGKPHALTTNGTASRFAYFWRPGVDACYAVILAPRAQQRGPMGHVMAFSAFPKGAQLTLTKASGHTLEAGAPLEQRYVIYWADGRRQDAVSALAQQVQSGELGARFFPPWGQLPEEAQSKGEAELLREYAMEVLAQPWEQERRVVVSSSSSVAVERPVVVKLNGKGGSRYAVLDSRGHAVWSQTEDADGDGTVDQLIFLVAVAAGSDSRYTLLSGPGDELACPSAFQVRRKRIGSWRPMRFVPTVSPGPSFGSSSISSHNQLTAQEQLRALKQDVAMTVLRGRVFHLTLGNESGLIEAMYPTALRGFAGSYFREFAPEGGRGASLELLANGPVRAVVRWRLVDGSRMLAVYRNGHIESDWQHPPKSLQLITAVHPYRFLATSEEDSVRFTQLLERKRGLPAQTSRHCLYGYEDLSLEIVHGSFAAQSEEVWLDPGELMFEVGREQQKIHNTTRADVRQYVFPVMAKLCRNYIGGGVRVVEMSATDDMAELSYRVGNRGARALGVFRERPVRITVGKASPTGELHALPVQPALEVEMPETSKTVMRIYPSRFHGWKLRPLVLAKQNPLPAFYPIVVTNRSDRAVTVDFGLELPPWMLEAQLLSDEYLVKDIRAYRTETSLGKSDAQATVEVRANGVARTLLRVRAKEETLGTYPLRARWGARSVRGSFDLTLVVKPDIVFFTKQAGYHFSRQNTDVLGHFSNARNAGGMYWLLVNGGLTSEREEWVRWHYRDLQRNGILVSEHVHVNQYIGAHATQKKWGASARDQLYQLPPEEFSQKVAALLRRHHDLEPYRYHIYLADEVWEQIGGYKGRRRLSVERTGKMIETILQATETPSFNSFMIHGVDAQFHVTLPNDIPFAFFYCGHDDGVREYARKLYRPRQALFESWCQDPKLLERAGTRDPKALFAFWISAQLHVTDYRAIRRHLWWLRHSGFDLLALWAMGSWNIVYAGTIGDWSAMGTGTDGFILTDRTLAIMDARQDMQLITLVRLIKESATAAQRREIEGVERRALELSQDNRFDEAVHLYVDVVRETRPDLLPLTPPDTYRPIKAFPLPDPTANEKAFAEAARQIPEIVLPRISGRHRPVPTVDGRLDNAYLEEGATLSDFYRLDGTRYAAQATRGFLARDDSHLYVFFLCRESQMDRVRERVADRDGSVYTDDSIEIFIQPSESGDTYFQLVGSVRGTRCDVKIVKKVMDSDWNPDWTVAVSRGKSEWTLEARIPFSVLGAAPQAGAVWRMNFCRNETPDKEISSWSAAFGSFHNQRRFGRVRFGGR